MAKLPTISIAKLEEPSKGTVVFLAPEDGKPSPLAAAMDTEGRFERATKLAGFKGKIAASVEILAPSEKFDRVLLVGCGNPDELDEHAWMRIGGKICAASANSDLVTVICETENGALPAEAIAAIAGGVRLRSYKFDSYKTRDKAKKKKDKTQKFAFATPEQAAAQQTVEAHDSITSGVITARDLVNEPANVLDTLEFAKRANALAKLWLEVEILDEKAMKK